MRHIILIHALFMKPFTLKVLGEKLRKISTVDYVHYFSYKSTKYSKNVLDNLNELYKSLNLTDDDEIIFIGHSMGGLIGRLFLTHYNPSNIKCLITLGTPHKGSQLGKFLSTTPFILALGSSGKAGITETITEWENNYPLYCIAGNYHKKLFLNLFNLNINNENNDGTVFVEEAILDNSTKNIIVDNTSHMQLIFADEVFNQIKKVLDE